jgi:hypothetical protein
MRYVEGAREFSISQDTLHIEGMEVLYGGHRRRSRFAGKFSEYCPTPLGRFNYSIVHQRYLGMGRRVSHAVT